ncbi:MAG: isocitrate/isopropylmalate dehydrogenase family protein [Methanomassiliicoccales archaeon]|nr:MAG: isocitrate/isopropylmalate dehydrogenase family protein [Methanomassiliicoccales archaeon]
MHKVAVLPGDGIGPEVVNEAMKVLHALEENYSVRFSFTEMDINSERYLRTGKLLTQEDIDELRKFDAIFLGAIGDDRVAPGVLEKGILLAARFAFDQYINHRPAQLWRPFGRLKRDVDFKIDVFRENTEDFYIGIGGRFNGGKGSLEMDLKRQLYDLHLDVKGTSTVVDDFAIEIGVMSRKNIERFADYVISQAKLIGTKEITVVDKANVLSNIYHLWRDVWNEKCRQAGMNVGYMYVDAMSMALVKNPDKFRVIATPNMFGDILTDLLAEVTGGLGLAPGGNINPKGISMYEPVHGSAPKYKGMNTINPVATILAAKLMLDNLGHRDLGSKVETAVRNAFDKGICTRDLGGNASTSQMGDAVVAELRDL